MNARTGPGTRPTVRSALVLAGSALALVVSAGPAAAHNVLTGSDPADGATVQQTPTSVVLTFDQPAIAMGTQLLVTGPTGPAQTGPPGLVDTTVEQSLSGGAPAGRYTVAWRATSADGHPVSGTFSFTSLHKGAGTPAPPTTSTTPPAGTAAKPPRLLPVLAVAAAALAGVTTLLLRRRRHPSDDSVDQHA